MTFDEEDNDNDIIEDNNYCNKFFKLMRKCESIKLDNERLINNIYKIKKLSQKYEKHKRILIKRLQKHRDDYKNCEFPLFVENEEMPQLNRDSQKGLSNLKAKSSITKSNGSATHLNSKPKKSKPINSNRNESTSHASLSGAPKKPINPYLLFCQENRSSVQEKYQIQNNTEISHQDLTKQLAQNWHELPVNAKQVTIHVMLCYVISCHKFISIYDIL